MCSADACIPGHSCSNLHQQIQPRIIFDESAGTLSRFHDGNSLADVITALNFIYHVNGVIRIGYDRLSAFIERQCPPGMNIFSDPFPVRLKITSGRNICPLFAYRLPAPPATRSLVALPFRISHRYFKGVLCSAMSSVFHTPSASTPRQIHS